MPTAIRFWCEALRYRPLRAPVDDWAILVPIDGNGPQFAISRVTSEAISHQRHHVDLYAQDAGREIDRLISLGAARLDWRYEEGADYTVLADPDGNKFCAVQKPKRDG